MKCPKCQWDTYFGGVIDGETPCIACGYDMDGIKFYNEATSEYHFAMLPHIEGEK